VDVYCFVDYFLLGIINCFVVPYFSFVWHARTEVTKMQERGRSEKHRLLAQRK
jgi:hypothetical protein